MHAEREKRSGGRRAVKRGAAKSDAGARGGAGLGLAAAVALVATALVAAWLWTRDARPAGSAGPTAESVSVADARATETAVPEAPRDRSAADASARPDERADPDRFRGRGRIRGEILRNGVELPRSWTLEIEPHPSLVGHERAERRSVRFERGETSFDVGDLPLGGYRVRAAASGLNSLPESVLLVRASPDVFVSLRFAASGFVDGFVLDDSGAPAEGVRVTIEQSDNGDRESVTTDAAGAFLVRDVVDGEHTIRFGEWESPLVPAAGFTFRAPSMRWRETRLPPTGSMALHARDAQDRPVADAEVVGSATPRGALRGRTEADGTFVARHLLPGRWSVTVKAMDGTSGSALLDVRAGVRAEAVVALP